MNNKVSTLVALGLLGCSMLALAAPPTKPAAPWLATPQKGPPVITTIPFDSLKPKPSIGPPYPRACYLGKDCMALDSKPFEFCRLAGKDCGDKQPELLLVGQAPVKKP